MSLSPKEEWYSRFVNLQGMLKNPLDIDMIKSEIMHLNDCKDIVDKYIKKQKSIN